MAVWYSWISGTASTSATVTCSSANDSTWIAWNGGTISSATTSATNVWTTWNSGTSTDYVPVSSGKIVYQFQGKVLTGEQLVAQQKALEEQQRKAEEQRVQWAKEAEERRVKEAEADARADELLNQFLNVRQRREYQVDKAFIIAANQHRNKFKIRRYSRVQEIDRGGKVIAEYCIHPTSQDRIPAGDIMLAQKMLLETNPDEFFRLANRTAIHQ